MHSAATLSPAPASAPGFATSPAPVLPFAPGPPAAGVSASPSPEQTAVCARRYEWRMSLMHDRTHAVLPGERKALCTAVSGEFNRWMPEEAHARRCPRCVGFLNRMRREQGLPERDTVEGGTSFRPDATAGGGSGARESADGGFMVFPLKVA